MKTKKEFKLFGGTVHSALVHTLTLWDMEQAKKDKYHNSYFLGIALIALERMEKEMDGNMLVLRSSIIKSFGGRLVDKLLKAVGEPARMKNERF